ncbi:MAG: recombinase family protein [Saprospiraceae bacterium]
MSSSLKIQPHHLIRKAIIYVRQSSPNQVLTNQESLHLQYALKQKALEMGWMEGNIEIIDTDLGVSGATTFQRSGFKDMLSKVALGEVGIIFSSEVTRLSRNCSDWYPLLDICGYNKCLIADNDGVYDPGTPNGRLLLGLKGQLSELELYTIRSRMTAGLLNKARRGELALNLPIGLIRDKQELVHKDPNQEVQNRLDLVFATFLRLGSAAKVVRYFVENHFELPRRDKFGDLVWKRPSVAAILSTLKNPAYAGAFVYGKSESVHQKADPRKKAQKQLPLEQWKIIVKDKYPAYISWKTFEKIRTMLKDNYAEYDRNKSRGVPRPGAVLLQGIIYCGKCGHKMQVQYKGGNQYLCNHLRQQYLVPVCQRFRADSVDEKVIANFFEAISEVELDAYAQAVAKGKTMEKEAHLAQQQQLKRLKYQANLAQRQYQKVDPDNRLVAAELEARWEKSLRELKQAELRMEKTKPEMEKYQLPKQMVESFKAIGQHLPQIWQESYLKTTTKKSLLRSLIEKVVVHRIEQDKLQIRIVWKGGATTTNLIRINVGSFSALSDAKQMEEQIVELAKKGISDQQIALKLTQQGHRSPMNETVLTSTVKTIRLRHRILINPSQSHPRKVPGYLTISQLSKKLQVWDYWIYDRINNQTIQIEKNKETRGYLFPDNPKTIENLLKLKNGEVKNVIF